MTPQEESRRLITFCWVALLLASSLPSLVLDFVMPGRGDWTLPLQLLILSTMLAATMAERSWRGLTGLLLTLLALAGGHFVSELMLTDLPAWRNWVASFAWGPRQVVLLIPLVIPAALMLASFLGSGITRRQMFLDIGVLNAPYVASKLFGFRDGNAWWRVAAGYIGVVGGLTVLIMLTRLLGANIDVEHWFANFGWILLAAAGHALLQELMFRGLMFARLLPLLPPFLALVMVTVFFAVSQPTYGLLAVPLLAYVGWLWGKSVLETGGIAWSFAMHWATHTAVLSALAMLAEPGTR